MNSVLDALVKLPRFVKILATNGIDENNAIVLNKDKEKSSHRYNKDYCKRWYENHKEQKKNYVARNKDRIAECHKKYYLEHTNNKNKRNGKILS